MEILQTLTGICILIVVSKAKSYECEISANECETTLIIEQKLTMMHPTEKAVYPQDGKLYRFDVTNTTDASPIPPNEVITADGWEDPRLVIVANGSMPGPPIIAYEGQTITINVINKLLSQETTIHWHGINQKGTPYMDGAPFVTQCPIGTGQTFVYRFKALNIGTHWYHSHVGNQRVNGLFGAFIVRKKIPLEMPEYVMTIQEWNHDWDADLEEAKMIYGMFENRTEMQLTTFSLSLDGHFFSVRKSHSGLINGRGRFWNHKTNTHNGAPLEIFNVQQGNRYRFRVIGAGSLFPWVISIDGHNLTIVASDGFEVEPIITDSFIINAGERYDFTIMADQPVANYWIRAKTLESNKNTTTEAILHYNGAPNSDPNSTARTCTVNDKCLVINCFFLYYPADDFTDCLPIDKLRQRADNSLTQTVNTSYFKEFFLNFAFPGGSSVNGRKFILPTQTALTDPTEINYPCENANCGEQKSCRCTYSLNINNGDTVQMIFLNMGIFFGSGHPVHIHGHSFQVLKIGYGKYNNLTGVYVGENLDIDCKGGTTRDKSYCNDATWSDTSWAYGNIPGIDSHKSIRKDTVIVPSGGYVVTRFVADNPGVWLLHCHIEDHMNDGMMMIINESFSLHPHAPNDFPRCHSFKNINGIPNDQNVGDTSKNLRSSGVNLGSWGVKWKQTSGKWDYVKYFTKQKKELGALKVPFVLLVALVEYFNCNTEFRTEEEFWTVVGVLCGIIFVQFVVLLCCCRNLSSKSKSYNANASGKSNLGYSLN